MAARDEWTRWVEAWWQSGMTARGFAAAHGLNDSTLRYNARMVKRARAAGEVKLARVEVVRSRGAETPIEVEVGGARVVVRRGFDRETLGEVLEVLGGRR